MANELQTIPLANLALAFIPVIAVIFIMARWTLNAGTGVFALARMLVQLILIGYLLNWIFATESSVIVIAILCFMLLVASWIAMRPLQHRNKHDFLQALLAITLGGCLTLALISVVVLELEPWYAPRQVIPLAGMIFASAMNTISLTAERLEGELNRGTDKIMARQLAYKAGLIPLLNSLFAVGLVSLPGMMTGQILSGVSPLIAVRYQVVVMCMLTGASGISAAIYLTLALRHKFSD
jgi:putative ABC transport system permease protein